MHLRLKAQNGVRNGKFWASNSSTECLFFTFRLRTHYVKDPASSVTQTALWRAYREAAGHDEQAQLQSGRDFITNVSTTFSGATAVVIQTNTEERAYLIRGIRSCTPPVNPSIRLLGEASETPQQHGALQNAQTRGPHEVQTRSGSRIPTASLNSEDYGKIWYIPGWK